MVGVMRGLLGIGVFVFVAWLFSRRRNSVNWRLVACGVLLQIAIGAIVLNEPVQRNVFDPIDQFVQQLLGYSQQGSEFVMQSVERHAVLQYKEVVQDDGTSGEVTREVEIIGKTSPGSKTFAFWILPTVVFFSSIMTLLYYLGVMQPVVRLIARVMQYVLGTSGSESLSCSANIFMGQTEAPLVVKPFVETMTKSELHAVMVGGFATVAGGVLAMYAAVLQGIPGIAGHLVTASCMAAPGALVISKIVYPETEESVTMGDVKVHIEVPDNNAIEAAARGATEGMGLLINIVAMLIAFVALVAMFDGLLVATVGVPFTTILGYIFLPFAWLMGVPADECFIVGKLLGEKLVLTELIAYSSLRDLSSTLSMRTNIIASYALCGFANFASIGIQIGGIGGIAPSRRSDLAELAMSAMLCGMIVTCVNGTIAGIFLSLGF